MGSLGPADHTVPHQVLMSFNLDTDVAKGIVNQKKFFHLQNGLYNCQYLGALG